MKQIREIVLPGDELVSGNYIYGSNTYKVGEKIYSKIIGIKEMFGNRVDVIPLFGKYLPKQDEYIIGYIEDITPTLWVVDIKSPYTGILHPENTLWDISSENLDRYLNIGDVIYAKILYIDEIKRVFLTMKYRECKKLIHGTIIEVNPSKIPRIIGKKSSMLNLLRNATKCRILVGYNGRLLVEGENVDILTKVINKIELEAHTIGLTEKIKKYFDEELKNACR